MAYIQKRTTKDGKTSYRVQVRLRGFAAECATFNRLTDAKEWATKIEADMKAGRHFGQSKRHTFNELVVEYEKHAAGLKSFADRKRHLKAWQELFGDSLLSEITSARINSARSKMLEANTRHSERKTGDPEQDAKRPMSKRSPQTVNRYVAALSACLTHAVKPLEWLDRNPCRLVTKAKEKPGRVRFLSQDEMKRLLDASRPHADLYMALLLSLTTGARQSEIMGLRWPQVDFQRQTILLHETKNGEKRVLPLVGEAYTMLQERAKVRSLMDDRVFPPVKVTGKNRGLREAWDKALKTAEISDLRWHDLRHTAASYLVMSGVSLVEVAKILGHRTLSMVARYAHLADEYIVATGEKLAEKMGVA